LRKQATGSNRALLLKIAASNISLEVMASLGLSKFNMAISKYWWPKPPTCRSKNVIGDIGMVHGTSFMTQQKVKQACVTLRPNFMLHGSYFQNLPNINHHFEATQWVQSRGLCPLTLATFVALTPQPILNQKHMHHLCKTTAQKPLCKNTAYLLCNAEGRAIF